MFGRYNTMKTGLMLVVGGTLMATTIPAVSAAPLVPQQKTAEAQENAEQVTTSQIVTIALPEGAQRPATVGELASFNDTLQQVARKNNGTITRSEVLLWTGEASKTALHDLSERMKAAGYTYAPMEPFDAEPGRVTAIAAMRGDKSDSVIGLWIETKDNRTLLIWGRYVEGTQAATPAKAAPPAKVAAAPRKPAVKKPTATPKRVATAKPRHTSTPTRRSTYRSTYSQSSASRQAQAFKAYKDYQYVKYFGPISGSMYRSTKW